MSFELSNSSLNYLNDKGSGLKSNRSSERKKINENNYQKMMA